MEYEAGLGAGLTDGRYVTVNLDTDLQLPAVKPPTTPDTSQPVVVRASRDAALTAIVNTLTTQVSTHTPMVAWDDSGAHMMEVDCPTEHAADLTWFSTAPRNPVGTATLTLGNA